MTTFTFKRGDTFLLTCYYKVNGAAAALPAQVRAQLRTPVGVLVAELTATVVDGPGGVYTLNCAAAVTALWTPQMTVCDLQYIDSSGKVSSSETFQVNIVADVTHD